MDARRPAHEVRLTDLLAALSFGTDLGMGQPTEHVLRQSWLAVGLARRLGHDLPTQAEVLQVSMLAWVGCQVDAYEQAKWFGDEQVLKHDVRLVDLARPTESASYLISRLGHGRSPAGRARAGLGFLAHGRQDLDVMFENHWRAVSALAADLGLADRVRDAVAQTFERWDGKGEPDGLRGEEIALSVRLVGLADVVEVFHQAGGVEAAVTVALARAGGQFDPGLAALFAEEAPRLFAELDGVEDWAWAAPLGGVLDRSVGDAELEAALAALADFADVKSPYTLGHSRAVAELAGAAAERLGLDAPLVRRAGLVHDLGRLGVPNSTWDKEGRLAADEVERIRLHPYYTDRMLLAVPALAPLAAVATQHHERLDGSGYPRGLTGAALGPEGRVLAAADCHRAWSEPRPHRPALSPAGVADRLRSEVRAGRLDGAAVDAVLRSAGHRVRRRREWPAGLTAREVEVLRLLARGLTHRQIAEELVISRKTVANHAEHIYAKAGVGNRAMLSLFAVRHGLLDPEPATVG